MGKRGSTTASAAAGTAAKRAKTADTDASVVGNWVQTKIGEKELSNAEKIGDTSKMYLLSRTLLLLFPL
jgi:hypothetical protein